MLLTVLTTILKAALVLGAVIYWDDAMREVLPSLMVQLLPMWVWILPSSAWATRTLGTYQD